MLLQNKNISSAINGSITADKIEKTPRKIGFEKPEALKTPFVCALLIWIIASPPSNATEPLVEEAKNAVNCSEIIDSDARLTCFDAATKRLADILNSTSDTEKHDESAISAKTSVDMVVPSVTTEDESPTWASAPQFTEAQRAQDSPEFQATIVRITRNGIGRHRFYTNDSVIWEQTQIVDVRPPQSLPTVAKFRRRMTGNPTIQFDTSSRSYRVRRVE
jgi:hypothetical protein